MTHDMKVCADPPYKCRLTCRLVSNCENAVNPALLFRGMYGLWPVPFTREHEIKCESAPGKRIPAVPRLIFHDAGLRAYVQQCSKTGCAPRRYPVSGFLKTA